MFCSKCGGKMESADSFCPSCGNPCEGKIEITEEKIAEVPAKVKKKHFPIRIVGLISILILIVGFLGYLAVFTNFFVSDEKLIKDRLTLLVDGINEGDINKIESCLDKAQRDASGSVSEEGEAIIEGILNFGNILEKIPGIEISPEDNYNVKVEKIRNITINEGTAVVTADVNVKIAVLFEKSFTVEVELSKEKQGPFTRDWFVSDISADASAEGDEGVEL